MGQNQTSEFDMMLKQMHKLSSNHRKSIEESDGCGCFYCRRTWNPKEVPVKEWIDDQQTALCPFCGIDSVLCTKDVPQAMDKEFLAAMESRWFNEVC
jgi:hypothetical protein